MGYVSSCNICNADNREAIEARAQEAFGDAVSWRQVAREFDIPKSEAVKRHMTKHWESPADRAEKRLATDLEDMVVEAERELLASAELAPAEIRPLYLVAARNLRGVLQTKPSQKSLIDALKTIQDVTGMKQQNRMLLTFLEASFKVKDGPSGALPAPSPELNTGEAPIEAEVVA